MICKMKNSRIEIWNIEYINKPWIRADADKTKKVVQAEQLDKNNFLVEIVEDNENEN